MTPNALVVVHSAIKILFLKSHYSRGRCLLPVVVDTVCTTAVAVVGCY